MSAAWMRAVSSVVSLGTPVAETVWDAVSVVQAGGIVGCAGSAVSPAQRAPLPPSTAAPLLLELLLLDPPLLLELLLLAGPASRAPPLLLDPLLLLEAPASWTAPPLLELLLPLDELAEFPPLPLLLLELLPPELLLLLLPPVEEPELDSPPLLLEDPWSPPSFRSPAELPHATGPDTDNTTAKAPSHR